jgi:DNA-binding MarR family transcriptional regulator
MENEENEYVRALFEAFGKVNRTIHGKVFNEVRFKGRPGQLFLLFKLRRVAREGDEGMRVSDLAASFGITASGITQTVTSLEEQGLVGRSMDSEDRRAVRVHLTKQGARMIETAVEQYGSVFSGLIDHLGKKRAKQLVELMTDVAGYFDELDIGQACRARAPKGAPKEGKA